MKSRRGRTNRTSRTSRKIRMIRTRRTRVEVGRRKNLKYHFKLIKRTEQFSNPCVFVN